MKDNNGFELGGYTTDDYIELTNELAKAKRIKEKNSDSQTKHIKNVYKPMPKALDTTCCNGLANCKKAYKASETHQTDLIHDNFISVVTLTDVLNNSYNIKLDIAYISNNNDVNSTVRDEISKIAKKYWDICGCYTQKNILLCEIAKEISYYTTTSVKIVGYFEDNIMISKYYLLDKEDKDVLLHALK